MPPVVEKLMSKKPLQVIATLGLGTVLAWFAFDHLRRSDTESREFLQTKFVDHLANSAAAAEKQAASNNKIASAIEDFTDAQTRMYEELDDISDANRSMLKRLGEPIVDE